MTEKTIYEQLREGGLSRRDFVKFCGLVSGMMGAGIHCGRESPRGRGPAVMPAGVVAETLKNKTVCRSSGWSFRIAPVAAKPCPAPCRRVCPISS